MGVAHAPLAALPAGFVDEAPLAATVGELGPPVAGEGAARPGRRLPLDGLLFALAVTAFLGEWLSRRLRGLR